MHLIRNDPKLKQLIRHIHECDEIGLSIFLKDPQKPSLQSFVNACIHAEMLGTDPASDAAKYDEIVSTLREAGGKEMWMEKHKFWTFLDTVICFFAEQSGIAIDTNTGRAITTDDLEMIRRDYVDAKDPSIRKNFFKNRIIGISTEEYAQNPEKYRSPIKSEGERNIILRVEFIKSFLGISLEDENF